MIKMTVEIYKHDTGRLFISHSDKKLSTGLLLLNPHTEFQKHNRPVQEQLVQVFGGCTIKIFENGEIKEISLKEGGKLKIRPNQYHIHSNPYNNISITLWKFDGDITEIIRNLRKNLSRL